MTYPEYPLAGGVPQRLTREEIIEALRDNYETLCALMRTEDPTFRGYPDMEIMLNWIEEHGLPPKDQVLKPSTEEISGYIPAENIEVFFSKYEKQSPEQSCLKECADVLDSAVTTATEYTDWIRRAEKARDEARKLL